MIAENYDDTKDLKRFILFSRFFDCSNQMRYFDIVKSISKQVRCRIWL